MKISERLALLKAGYSKDEINAMIDDDAAKIEQEPAQEEKPQPVDDYMNVIKALASEVNDLKEAVYSSNIDKTEIKTASTKSAEDILAELFSAPKKED